MLVDFVRDGESVPVQAEVANALELRTLKYLSRGIVGRVKDNGFRLRAERRRQLVGIERPIGRPQIHKARTGAGKNRVGAVILVERLEDDDFISRIDDGHHGGHHCFRRTAANRDFALRINHNTLRAFEIRGNCVAKFFRAPGNRVLVDVRGNRVLRGALDLSRRWKIGKALRKIDRPVAQSQAGHFADYRFGEAFSFKGKFWASGQGAFGLGGVHLVELHKADDKCPRCGSRFARTGASR